MSWRHPESRHAGALVLRQEFAEDGGRVLELCAHGVYIREGDIFQVVLSNRLEAGFEGSLLDAYRVLRSSNLSEPMCITWEKRRTDR